MATASFPSPDDIGGVPLYRKFHKQNEAGGAGGMIESGSHVPGVSVAAFRLPPFTALRYEKPAPALTDYLNDYHVLDSDNERHAASVEWMLPSWSAIRIILADRPIALTLGGTRYDPLPVASLYGTTSRAMKLTTNGGVTVGITISPLGWSRLFRAPAARYRDRIVPLDEMMPPALVDGLVEQLRGSDRGPGVQAILDAFFLEHFADPHPDEPVIRTLMALIMDDATRDLGEAGAAVGIAPHTLRRVSARYFGFPPKVLLVRTRFLRALLPMLLHGTADYSVIGSAYYDLPHFLRDAKRFLGMTPRRFMAIPSPYLHAALRARAVVLGAAMAAVQRPGG